MSLKTFLTAPRQIDGCNPENIARDWGRMSRSDTEHANTVLKTERAGCGLNKYLFGLAGLALSGMAIIAPPKIKPLIVLPAAFLVVSARDQQRYQQGVTQFLNLDAQKRQEAVQTQRQQALARPQVWQIGHKAI